jgi:HAMP domain-containing protein
MNEPQKKGYKRSLKNIFILPRIQRGYVLAAPTIGACFVLIYSAAVYSHVSLLYRLFTTAVALSTEERAFLEHEFFITLIALGMCSALFLIGMTALLLRYSHRIAGPLYHFQRVLREVTSGNRSARITLRKSDELQELARDFNQMMDSLEKDDS